jgi:YVTN family beta-propeller protein
MKNRVYLTVLLAATLVAISAPWFVQADTLVVLNKSEATASLIDLDSGNVRATLPTNHGPHEAAVSPDGRLALVGNYGTREKPGSSLTVINVPEAKVIKTIDLGEYRRPHGLLFLPDGRRALITAEDNKVLLEVDVEKGTVVNAFATEQDVSHMVEVALGGRKAFVANIGSGSVSVIDLEKGIIVRTITTGAGAEGITASVDGKEIWVTNRSADTVSVIDAESLEILAQIPCASFPIRAKATPDGKHVLVSCARTADIAVLDAPTSRSSTSPRARRCAGFPRICAPSIPAIGSLATSSARALFRSALSSTRMGRRPGWPTPTPMWWPRSTSKAGRSCVSSRPVANLMGWRIRRWRSRRTEAERRAEFGIRNSQFGIPPTHPEGTVDYADRRRSNWRESKPKWRDSLVK